MSLLVECRRDARLNSVKVFGSGSGSGIGIWNGERQFHLGRPQVVSLLRALQQADFPGLAETYGGSRPSSPPRPPGRGAVTTMTCRIELALGRYRKEAAQLSRGEQSAALKRLAEGLLDTCAAPGAAGLAATSLRDGLQKIAAGQLAPETWVVVLHRKPQDDGGAVGRRGLLLTLAGAQATGRAYLPGLGYQQTRTLDLTEQEVRTLAGRLAALDPAAWPVNLYARDYTDLSIELLDHGRSIQAREFAGLQATTHGEHQKGFERAVALLGRLHDRVLHRGRDVPDPLDAEIER